MNKYINCSLFNIQYIEKDKIYILNTDKNTDKNIQHKIIFSKNKSNKVNNEIVHFQFKIYTKHIKMVEIIYKNFAKKFTNISSDGFLVSFDFDFGIDNVKMDNIEFTFYPDNLSESNSNSKSLIYIKKITFDIYQPSNLVNINWDKIFIINLERRIDRKLNMIKMFQLANIKEYEFIDGVDGTKQPIIDKFNNLKSSGKTKIITSGHFACLLSHIKAIEEAKTRGYKSIMILEDDVFLSNDFIYCINNIKIPPYDMVYLGGIINKKKLFFSHWVSNTKNILGAYGYILTSNLYDYVLKELTKLTDYVDLFYMNNIQPNYRVILLDDIVKTNLDSSDTSAKTLLMTRRLSYIK